MINSSRVIGLLTFIGRKGYSTVDRQVYRAADLSSASMHA